MHLETIIKDLRERFARVEVRVSPPLVAFRESVFITEEAPEPQNKPAKVRFIPCTLPNRALEMVSLVFQKEKTATALTTSRFLYPILTCAALHSPSTGCNQFRPSFARKHAGSFTRRSYN